MASKYIVRTALLGLAVAFGALAGGRQKVPAHAPAAGNTADVAKVEAYPEGDIVEVTPGPDGTSKTVHALRKKDQVTGAETCATATVKNDKDGKALTAQVTPFLPCR